MKFCLLTFLKLNYLAHCRDLKTRALFKSIVVKAKRGESGFIFELEMLKSIRLSRVRELRLEHPVSPDSNKTVDFFFPNINFGFELLAPIRPAVPAVKIDDIIPTESTFYNAIRPANCQGETLATLVNSKCKDKEFNSLKYPLVLLLDLMTSDLFENYFHDTATNRFQRICKDFSEFLQNDTLPNQGQNKNHWIKCNNIGLVLVERQKGLKTRFFVIPHSHSNLTSNYIWTALKKIFQ